MIAYITGATSGFGKAIARKLAQLKYNNILLGQKNVSEQDVYKAAQVANAELFI